MNCKLLLFDLDGTLLQTDKTISKQTMQKLEDCRKQGTYVVPNARLLWILWMDITGIIR